MSYLKSFVVGINVETFFVVVHFIKYKSAYVAVMYYCCTFNKAWTKHKECEDALNVKSSSG